MDPLRSACLLLLVKMICLPRLTLREKQSLFSAYGIYAPVCQSTFSYYFSRQMCPGLIHRVPVKSLGCKQKKLPLALLISTPFLDRQTNKKIPKKKKKKKRTSITYKALRVDCRMEGLVKRRNTTACSVLQKILWWSESEPPVLGTTPTQVSGHHPVSLSHVFMIQISAGRRCPRTELRGLLML